MVVMFSCCCCFLGYSCCSSSSSSSRIQFDVVVRLVVVVRKIVGKLGEDMTVPVQTNDDD